MNMNRRKVLTGLGGLAIGGGALLGTGAFTSVEAARAVEVNVVTPSDVSGADEDSDALADQFVDVRVDVGAYDSVYVNDASSGADDGTSLSPTSASSNPNASASEVSLIANDPATIIFGNSNNGLPENSTVNYTDLFVVDNADLNSSGTDAFDVTLELNGGDSDFLNIADSPGASSVGTGGYGTTTVGNDTQAVLDANVNTAESNEATELTIRIE